jgi:hypothetical protein
MRLSVSRSVSHCVCRVLLGLQSVAVRHVSSRRGDNSGGDNSNALGWLVGWLGFWLTAVALVEPAGFVVLVVVDAHDVDRSVLPFEHLQPLCETKRNAPFA